MPAKSETPASADPRQFIITRIFQAPRNLVYSAWTDPKQMSQWWGPHGFTNPVCRMDVRAGGAYRIVMRSPDNVDYPMKGIFTEVVKNERLVYTCDLSEHPDAWHDMIDPNRPKGAARPAMNIVTTVTFQEKDGQTLLTVCMDFESAKTRDQHVKLGMNDGWSQSFERLEKLISPTSTADRELVMSRTFDAPRDLVFDAWTDPKKIVHWWGPIGFTTTIHIMDVRNGGAWEFIMHGPDGVDYPNKNVYLEVTRPHRLVYDHVSSPKFRSTVNFTELAQQTVVNVQMLFASPAELEKVAVQYRAGEGLSQTLGRLKEFLAGK